MEEHWIDRTDTEKVRISISEFKGARRIDIRVYYLAADGEMKPTQKGVAIPVEQYQELKSAVLALEGEI